MNSINLCKYLRLFIKIHKPSLETLKHMWVNYSNSYQISRVTHSMQTQKTIQKSTVVCVLEDKEIVVKAKKIP